VDKTERELLANFENLNKEGKTQLLDYARFLKVKYGREPVPTQPLNIVRPDSENVIDAIKRLTKTYPMVSKKKMMGPSSELLSQHMMQGRAAEEVIDELEELFRKHYKEQCQLDE